MTTVLGGFICCVVPLLCFLSGIYYARFGLPLAVRWRGFRGDEESIEE
jgi:hypothetical protein